MPTPTQQPYTAACPSCGATNTKATTARPPRHHNGPCTPSCTRPARFCVRCRTLTTTDDTPAQP